MASSRSCVTKTTAADVSDHRVSSSFSMRTRVCTSSALNGSSLSRIFCWVIRLAAEGQPLGLPPGGRVRVAVPEAGQPAPGQPLAGHLLGLAARRPLVAGAGSDVVEDGLPG